MERMTADRALAAARLILLAEYVGALVVMPFVARVLYSMRAAHWLSPQNRTFFGISLTVFGIIDYGASLVIEKRMLEKVKVTSSPSTVVVVAVLVGAFGASLGAYGLVLASFGARQIAMLMFGLCFLHAVHLLLRWPRYAEAAQAVDSAQL